MANVLHKNLTGTDLHEPKGVAAATANQVYVADGAGSGAWFTLRFVGEIVDAFVDTEPTGYLFCNGDTIGNASSNATGRANADTSALFAVLWNIGDTYSTLAIFDSAGAASTFGADAATDFAANKAIVLPDLRERVSVGWDDKGSGTVISGTYLTTTNIGNYGGEDAVTLVEANIPEHDHAQSGTFTTTSNAHTHTWSDTADASPDYYYANLSTSSSESNDAWFNFANTDAGTGASRVTGWDSTFRSDKINISVSGTTSNYSHSHNVTLSGSTGTYGQASPDGVENIQPSAVVTKLIFYGA